MLLYDLALFRHVSTVYVYLESTQIRLVVYMDTVLHLVLSL
jgi:hypothetical protein